MNSLSTAFLVCWWPYAIAFMVGFHRFSKLTVKIVVILAYLNSLINPCLYMIINRDVRFQLRKIFRCHDHTLARQRSEDMEGSSNSNYPSLSLKRIQKMFTVSVEETPSQT